LPRTRGDRQPPHSRVTDCNIPAAAYRASKAQTLDFLAHVEREADVPVLRFDPLLCTAASCATELDGSILYRDEGHFSNKGSVVVARRMRLGEMVERVAR
jgi:hypothetical protein